MIKIGDISRFDIAEKIAGSQFLRQFRAQLEAGENSYLRTHFCTAGFTPIGRFDAIASYNCMLIESKCETRFTSGLT
jgi:hypothetical protein